MTVAQHTAGTRATPYTAAIELPSAADASECTAAGERSSAQSSLQVALRTRSTLRSNLSKLGLEVVVAVHGGPTHIALKVVTSTRRTSLDCRFSLRNRLVLRWCHRHSDGTMNLDVQTTA